MLFEFFFVSRITPVSAAYSLVAMFAVKAASCDGDVNLESSRHREGYVCEIGFGLPGSVYRCQPTHNH